jgi:cytochrome b6-f complex iron-sulfur subunit
MADKKKMSVAEILAAARKADNKAGGAAPASPAAESSATSPAEETPAVEASAPAEPAAAAEVPAAPKPAAKPLAKGERPNVKDILAMARAKSGAAAAVPAAKAPSEKPAAPKPAAKPVAEKVTTAKPAAKVGAPVAKDTASILAAARKGSKPGPMSKSEAAAAQAKVATKAPPKEKLTVPPMPAKPAYAKLSPAKAAASDEDRRGFFQIVLGSALGLGMTALSITGGLWALGTARFMFPNILTEPPSRFKVGFKDNFAPGQVETKFVATNGVWVVNGEYNGKQQIYALKTVCTHLGCTPNWLEGEQKFKCPCHGSGFYKDGINFEGPAPRPLERYAIRVGDDQQLEIDKSKTFQEELGQWTDPDCFVTV